MTFYSQEGLFRTLEGGAYAASTAVLTGELHLGTEANIWFGCVLRGDDAPIHIGSGTNIQDLTMVHADPGVPNVIGSDVTVGHGCVLHGVSIQDRCLIGMGSVLLGGTHIGAESIIAAGAVVLEGKEIPPRSLVVGVPGRVVREVTDEEVESIRESAADYIKKAHLYLPQDAAGG